MYGNNSKINLQVFLLFLGVILGFVLSSCQKKITTEELNVLFSESLFSSVELNSGLQIKAFSTSLPIILDVYNTSEESIQFNDHTFNLQAFWPDENSNQWMIVKIPYTSLTTQKVYLPSGLTSYDPKIGNHMVLVEDFFETIGYEKLRLYIEGEGVISGRVYGAYIDVWLHP